MSIFKALNYRSPVLWASFGYHGDAGEFVSIYSFNLDLPYSGKEPAKDFVVSSKLTPDQKELFDQAKALSPGEQQVITFKGNTILLQHRNTNS